MRGDLYHNVGRHVHLILRRDRIRIPVWLISLTVLTLIVTVALTQLCPTEQERQTMAETMMNPAVTAMFGPGYGFDDYTYGIMMGHQMLLFTALAVAIMNILLVTRHTRADEEAGRIEILRSLPVGRLSNLGGAAVVSVGVNVLLAVMVGFGLYALGVQSVDLQGSLLYGALLGAAGLFFAAVTALFAQLSESSRGTAGLGFGFLVVAYLIRAVGDTGNEILSWISPLGWIVRSQVYLSNYWWPVMVTAAGSLAVMILALYLNSIRDLEAGFLPARPGRKTASVFLQSPLGLALRLQRTGLVTWAVGMFILGASYGSVMGDLEAYIESLDLIQAMLPAVEGFTLTEQFIPMLMSVISMASAIPVLLMLLRLAAEERHSRTEPLLARAVSRRRLMGSYLGIAVIISPLLQMLAAVGMWSAAAAVMEDPLSLGMLLTAALAYLPAMWVMIGVGALLIGIFPRGTGLTWLYLGYSFFVVYLGGVLQVPEWMATLSPFGSIPKLPVEDLDFVRLSILTLIALALTVVGFRGYRTRDMQG